MIKAKDLRQKLEDAITMLTSDYSPEQWEAKSEVDKARHKEAMKLYDEADDAIGLCEIDWDDSSDEDYDAITLLMDKLAIEIQKLERKIESY